MKSFTDFGFSQDEVLEEIETDDLIEELETRGLSGSQEDKLLELMDAHREGECDDSDQEDGFCYLDHFPNDTIENQFKTEHLLKVWDKYTSAQIEALLPE